MKQEPIENVVEGFLTDLDKITLYRLAKRCKGLGSIVEIGSYKGMSTIQLARGSQDGCEAKVYAIDHHKGSIEHRKDGKSINTFKEFKRNIELNNLNDFVVPMVMTSKKASRKFKGDIELLFIDGSHKYEDILIDLKSWFPKVINGGIIAFHDNNWDSTKKVINAYIKDNPSFNKVKEIGMITYCKKVGDSLIKLPITK